VGRSEIYGNPEWQQVFKRQNGIDATIDPKHRTVKSEPGENGAQPGRIQAPLLRYKYIYDPTNVRWLGFEA
jgi:hypothetical protein